MTIQLGIIGFPIGHSLSPVFQQAALDHLKLDATYSTWEIYPGDLGSFIDGLRSPDIQGINVTVPHKEAVLPLLDHVDEWALQAGAVKKLKTVIEWLTFYKYFFGLASFVESFI